jgi:hypothetical protein
MVNKERWDYCDKVGTDAEKMFVDACTNIGYVCTKSDTKTNMYDHIDFFVTRENGTTSVDVKGCNSPKEIWVEFKNVRGENGWLYGMAQYIAFDMPHAKGFIVVSRKELLEYCDNVVEKVYVSKEEATRKLYTREGRKDVITKLELTDLAKLKSFKKIEYSETKENTMPV